MEAVAKGVHIEELTEEEAVVCWRKESRAPSTKGTELKKSWKLWLRNKVFIRNKTGEDIIVYVQRSNAASVLTSVEVGAGGSPLGGGVYARLDFAHKDGRVAKAIIPVTQEEKMFELGGGADGAYVTVMLEGDTKQLFCKEEQVACGYRLNVLSRTFPDPSP
ncbi:hypothetical protein N2152v2_010495 [Parachlorella kessleri]